MSRGQRSPRLFREESRRRLFFLLHRPPTTFYRSRSAFGHDHLRATLPTDINFAKLISHFCRTPEIRVEYCARGRRGRQLDSFENRFALFQESLNPFSSIGRGL
jgi:hypothetical protein